jgi:benzoyl-CoA reductase subunit B
MVIEEKKKTISRLKSMYPLRAQVNEAYAKSTESMKAGKPTVWAMLNFYYGDPILKAMDIEVLYPENYGGVLAAFGAAQPFLDWSDAEGFPTHLCGYSRASLGYTAKMMKEHDGEIPPDAPMGGLPKPLFLLASTAICDARYKWFQALGRYLDVPVWNLESPAPGVKEMFMEGTYERIWYEINELRKTRPSPMHSRDFWSAMGPALFLLGNPKETLPCFKDMYDEVKERVDKGIGAIPEEKYRMVFAELPPWHSLDLFDKLAERGWNFVVESFGYRPPIPIDLSNVKDPLERMTKFSMQKFLGYYEDARKNNILGGAFAYPYLKYTREWRCDGALLHPLISCRSASTHLPFVANMLLEKLKVPSLIIEGDIVDLRLFDADDALARAEPFEQTMNHYKSVRRKEGFDW